MISVQQLSTKKSTTGKNRWWETFIAIIALLNFCLVLFDLTYIPWRDFYFQEIPSLTQLYDSVKGIEPHRETQRYLNTITQLKEQLSLSGLQSPQVENLLAQARQLSNELIEDNPFAIANKTGNLEKIKNQIRDRVGIASSHYAFATFWSQAYLSQAGWEKELNFFHIHIQPLIETNYYRSIGINGKYTDRFWLIDLPFVVLFSLNLLVRTIYLYRTQPQLNWLEALLRRWYDVFLLLPFWRWLRVIPLTIHLYQANLLNLDPVRKQIRYDFATNFAEELTEIVGVRLIDQIQESIERGDMARWLFRPETRRPYINVNNTNEVQAIASRLLHLTVYHVLPKIQPEIEVLLHHSLEKILNQSPIYQQLQHLPGFRDLPQEVTQKLVANLSQTTYATFTDFLEDPVVLEMTNRLWENFNKSLELELQKQHNLQEIQSLLRDMLEEIKINYVKGIELGGVEKSLEEATQIRQTVKRPFINLLE